MSNKLANQIISASTVIIPLMLIGIEGGCNSKIQKTGYNKPNEVSEKVCEHNLGIIFDAIEKFDKKNHRLPFWLGELTPILGNTSILICPLDPTKGGQLGPQEQLSASRDPIAACSYIYEFAPIPLTKHHRAQNRNLNSLNKTNQSKVTSQQAIDEEGVTLSIRDISQNRFRNYGRFVPLVRCFWHSDNLAAQPAIDSSSVLNLSSDGSIYKSGLSWQTTIEKIPVADRQINKYVSKYAAEDFQSKKSEISARNLKFRVFAEPTWLDTGVFISKNLPLSIQCSGTWNPFDPVMKPVNWRGYAGSSFNKNNLTELSNWGAIVARVGNKYLKIDDDGVIKSPVSGDLLLGMNNGRSHTLQDQLNAIGVLTVQIRGNLHEMHAPYPISIPAADPLPSQAVAFYHAPQARPFIALPRGNPGLACDFRLRSDNKQLGASRMLLCVTAIDKNGPAYKAGVHVGDFIKKINDIDTTMTYSKSNLRRISQIAHSAVTLGRTVSLSLQTGNEAKEIKFRVQ